ncbi:MAG: hypothetical protein GXX85_01530 [Ignavibacteria bacterium]|nr:hypothetical protein [Ignavibacteria bacterium]
MGNKVFLEIKNRIAVLSSAGKNLLIGIGGPGGTGKTNFTKQMLDFFPSSRMISLDDYRFSRESRKQSGLKGSDPCANKIELIKQHLNLIKENSAFTKPVYNPETGCDNETELFNPAKINFIEGELVFFSGLVNYFDLLIHIDSDKQTQFKSRLNRDKVNKSLSMSEVQEIFLKSNVEDYEKHYKPNIQKADILLFADNNYNISIIKK